MRHESSDIQSTDAGRRALNAVVERYTASNPASAAQIRIAARHLAGGNTRVALHYDPFPIVIDRAQTGQVYDLDGHSYIDLMNDLTAGFYGHSNPVILESLRSALERGLSYGGPNVYEQRLAQALCARFRSMELVRFCNSGTEANLLALQLCRAVTGRAKVLAFDGGYHGSFSSYLPGMTSLNVEGGNTLLVDFNDIDSARRAAAAAGGDLAAIIVEPMMGSGGSILAERAFLTALGTLADETGALLIFDEVQTARLAAGGLQAVFGVVPHLTTLGKFCGGGLAFGAVGGRADLIGRLDPTRADRIGHGGTFNNSILTMVAGFTGLSQIATAERLHEINQRADRLRVQLQEIAKAAAVPLQTGGFGSIIAMHFQEADPKRSRDCTTSPVKRKLMHLELLLRGFYVPRRGTINLSLATTDADCEAYAAAFADILNTHGAILRQQ